MMHGTTNIKSYITKPPAQLILQIQQLQVQGHRRSFATFNSFVNMP